MGSERLDASARNFPAVFLLAAALALPVAAQAAVGVTEIAGKDGSSPVTIFYPSSGEAQPLKRGPFTLDFAAQSAPVRGNGRLIVVSHGSGGSPWVHSDLARALVESGFVVAMPEHRGDNYKDMSAVGPESWKRRPAEVSRAIDAVGQDPRFAPLLAMDRVGMFGMSAGGHTALSLAGGRWSPALFKVHCKAHIAEDFYSCVGLATRLNGGFLDGLKKSIALAVIRWRFDDATWYTFADPRIAAVVAAVPYATDFDMDSLAAPRVPLALITARQDKWLLPRFHSDRVLQACAACERLADLQNGGHGALLSPFPPGLSGLVADLLNDPPGFDRSVLPEVDRRIAAFFRATLRQKSPQATSAPSTAVKESL
jgi:predicted dienelactone hydrolase